MRVNLIARGLIDADNRLTAEGHAEARAIMRDLATKEAANDPDGPRVRWDFDFSRRGVPWNG